MIFGRVKPLDAILATAEKKSLHRSLGAFQLTLLGIGCIIGTGIFVLTAEAAQKAGPGMMLASSSPASVCAVAALCYAEIASMVPVVGLRLHLQLCGDGRVARLDGRLGAGPRICHRRRRGLGRLVGLFRRAADPGHRPSGIVMPA